MYFHTCLISIYFCKTPKHTLKQMGHRINWLIEHKTHWTLSERQSLMPPAAVSIMTFILLLWTACVRITTNSQSLSGFPNMASIALPVAIPNTAQLSQWAAISCLHLIWDKMAQLAITLPSGWITGNSRVCLWTGTVMTCSQRQQEIYGCIWIIAWHYAQKILLNVF